MIRIILCALMSLIIASGGAPGSDFSYSSSEYALYAGGNASLGDRADVSGRVGIGGNLTISTDVNVGGDLFVGGNVWSSERVTIDGWVIGGNETYIRVDNTVNGTVQSASRLYVYERAHVTGDLIGGNLVSVNSSAVIDGSTSDYAAMEHTWTEPSATFPSFSPGSTNNWPAENSTLALDPGSYRDMSAANGCTIQLRSGTYQFQNLWVKQNVRFEIDDSAGPVDVRVSGSMSIGDGTRFTVSTGSADGFELSLNNALSVGQNVQMTGHIVARGDVSVDNGFTIAGSIYTESNFWSQTDLEITAEAPPPVLYVSTRGSNGNSGLSPDAPLATIQHAIAMCTVPGATIYIAPGTYNESLSIGTGTGNGAVSGTDASPTRVIGDVGAEHFNANPGAVVLDGRDAFPTAISMVGVTNWSFEDIDLIGYQDYGFSIVQGSASILRSEIDVPSEYAIFANPSGDMLVQDCVLDRSESSGHGIWVVSSSALPDLSFTIERNRIHESGDRYGSSWHSLGESAREQFGSQTNLYGIVTGSQNCTNLSMTIANNIVSDTYLGVLVYSFGAGTSATVANNTALWSCYPIYVQAASNGTATVVNNIAAHSYYGLICSGRVSVPTHLEASITADMDQESRGYDPTNNVTESPRFVEPESGDFSLAWGSGGLDQGQRVSVATVDIMGTARPLDGDDDEEFLYDMGAYESDPVRDRARFVRWREISGRGDREDP